MWIEKRLHSFECKYNPCTYFNKNQLQLKSCNNSSENHSSFQLNEQAKNQMGAVIPQHPNPGRTVWSYQSYKGLEDQESSLVLG